MLIFPDPNVETEYTDPNGSVWEFNGTGWVRQCDCDGSGGGGDGFSMGSILIPANNDFIEIAPVIADALTFNTGDFSIEFWFRGTPSIANILNPKSISGAGSWGAFINSGNLQWNHQYNAANLLTANASSICNGNWHHVYFVRSSGSLNVFWDGNSSPQASAPDSSNYNRNFTLQLGKGNVNQNSAFEIADLRIVKGGRAYNSYNTSSLPQEPLGLDPHRGEVVLLLNGNKADSTFVNTGPIDYVITPSGGVQVSEDNPYGTYRLWRHGYPDLESQTQDDSNDSEPLGDNQ